MAEELLGGGLVGSLRRSGGGGIRRGAAIGGGIRRRTARSGGAERVTGVERAAESGAEVAAAFRKGADEQVQQRAVAISRPARQRLVAAGVHEQCSSSWPEKSTDAGFASKSAGESSSGGRKIGSEEHELRVRKKI